MGSSKRPDPPPPAENTIGVTQSQILSVSPTRLPEPPTPPRPSRPVEMSMWGGNVLAADDFAPDAGRKARRRGRVALIVIVGGVLAAGGWLWRSWPKLPWMSHAAPASAPNVSEAAAKTAPAPTVAAPAPTVAAPAPTVAAPAPKVAAPAPTVAAPTPVAAAPSQPAPAVKPAHTRKPTKIASSKRHHKSSRTKRHSHAKSVRSTAPTDG